MDETRLKAAVRRVNHDYTRLAVLIKSVEGAIERKGKAPTSPLSDAEWAVVGQLFDGLQVTIDDLELVDRWLNDDADAEPLDDAA